MADGHLLAFENAEGALWYQNGMITEKGTVYCVASI